MPGVKDFLSMSNEDLKSYKYEVESKISKRNNSQLALKYLMNGEYGALGNIFFRYYDIRLASAVTLCGRLAIRWIENYIMDHPLQKKYKWEVIYSDTDSLYIELKWLVIQLKKRNPDWNDVQIAEWENQFCKKILEPIIDEGYEKLAKYVNANENRMFMKREKIATVGLWTDKKKYATLVLHDEKVVYPEPKLKVKGLETVRSSTPEFVRKKLENVIKLILTDETKLSEYIEEVRQEFYTLEPEEIAFVTGVNTLSKYEATIHNAATGEEELTYKKGCPIGVRAAITHNSYIIKHDLFQQFPEIMEGDKIKYVYMKTPNYANNENVFGFLRVPPDKERIKPFVDYKTQFEKTFMAPITNITNKIKMILRDAREFDINELF